MEGVGARLGRSSTRYGPATVFTGPVRKWKKKWVPVANPNGGGPQGNGNGGGNNASHLVLYKWTPISSAVADKGSATEESPSRKFRYVPVYMTDEHREEESLKAATDDETKPSKLDNKKLNTGNFPVEETEGDEEEREAASDANLDLSLGLNSHDTDRRA